MPVHSFLKRFFQFNFRIFLFILIFIFFSLVLFTGSIFFKVKNIKVFGLNSKFSLFGVSDLKEKNILLLSTEGIQNKLFQANPSVKKILVEKMMPQTLIITVENSKPIAIFKANGGYFYLNDLGRVILKSKEIKNEALTLINFYQKIDFNTINSGDNLDYVEIIASLRYLKRAKELGLIINTIDIAGTYMIGLNLKESKVFLSTEKSIDKQLMEFETVIQHFKVQGQKFKKLDLRFNKPVVELD